MEKIDKIRNPKKEKDFICANRHKERVYLVTGSSMGIGFEILKRLAQEGARVILTSRRKESCSKAEETLQKLGLAYDTILANFNNKEERAKVYELIQTKYGFLSGLVCNVAVSPHFGKSLEINEKEFSKIFDVNVKNTFFTIKEFYPLLKKAENASILIVASVAGYLPFTGIGVYSISKTTLLGMVKLLASELASDGIRVNGIAPGIIKTRFAEAIVDSDFAKTNFLGRPGITEECGGISAFLLSEDASYITGEIYGITGGVLGKF